MSNLSISLESFVGQWWLTVMHSTWQSALLAAFALLVTWRLRRRASSLCYGLLLIALLKFAVPPMVALPTGVFSHTPVELNHRVMVATAGNFSDDAPAVAHEIKPATAHEAVAAPVMAAPVTQSPAGAEGGFSAEEPKTTLPPSEPKTVASSRPSWRAMLLGLHVLGALLMACWMVSSWYGLVRLVRQAAPITNETVLDRFSDLMRRLGIRRKVRLLVARDNLSPMSFGILRPTVLLPASLVDKLSEEELSVVLAHELVHHRRKDTWWILIEDALLLVWWFNPILWVLVRELRRTREDCCDDFVLASGVTGHAEYCDSLVRAARTVGTPRPAHAALGFADNLHPLGRRLKRIMDTTLRRPTKRSIWGILAILAVALAVLPGLRVMGAQETASKEPGPKSVPSRPSGVESDRYPGEVFFRGWYQHGSQENISELVLKEAKDGSTTSIVHMPYHNNLLSVASGGSTNRLLRYEESSNGQGKWPSYSWALLFEGGKAYLTRWGFPRWEDVEGKELEIPAKAVFNPNSAPDPFCAANILLRGLGLKEGESKEAEVFDWDVTGEALAGYHIKLEHKGREEVSVPAGVFHSNHIVLTQLTTAKTWFKKREGHITEFWTLDNGVIVSVLRHHGSCRMELVGWQGAKTLPGLIKAGEPSPSGKLTILSALYGAQDKWVDITEKLNGQIQNNRLEITVSNRIAGDPIPNVSKKLNIHYRVGETLYVTSVDGLDHLRLPELRAASSVHRETATANQSPTTPSVAK